MIYIFHGEDLSKSRQTIFTSLSKASINEKVELDITQITPEQFQESLMAKSLFGERRSVILDITSLGRTNAEDFIQKAKNTPADLFLFILSGKTLTATNSFIKNATALNAKVICNDKSPEGQVFHFVDALFAKQRHTVYKELALLTKDEEDSFRIFAAVIYGLRNVALVKFNSPSSQKMSPFIKSKAVSQAKNFSEDQLNTIFHRLYQIEKDTKTGELMPDLMLTSTIEKVLNS